MKVVITTKDGRVFEGSSSNVSMGGISVECSADVAKDTECTVSVLLGESEDAIHIEGQGKIVRCDSEYLAVSFYELSLGGLEHLRNLIRYNSAEEIEAVENEFSNHIGLKRRESSPEEE